MLFVVIQAFEQRKSLKTVELAAQVTHDAELASTRRCPAAGMDHIRAVVNDTDTWMRHCLMDLAYMDTVNKTKVHWYSEVN